MSKSKVREICCYLQMCCQQFCTSLQHLSAAHCLFIPSWRQQNTAAEADSTPLPFYFYRAISDIAQYAYMLSSIALCKVCLSKVGVLPKWLFTQTTIAQELYFSYAKPLTKISGHPKRERKMQPVA